MGLRQLVSAEYRDISIGEAVTGAEALVRLSQRKWNLVFLTIDLPDQNGFSLLGKICRYDSISRPRVILMGMHSNPVYARRARQLGASCYISLSSGTADLQKAIRTALAPKNEIRASNSVLDAPRAAIPPHTKLSAREYQVMQALASGAHVGEIAVNLKLNIKTVSTYKRRIFDKLRIGSTAELVRYLIGEKVA